MKYSTTLPPALKTTVFLIFLFVMSYAYGQNSNYSPYSRFGLGEYNLSRSVTSSAMGHVTLAIQKGSWLNPLNPASYTAMDTLSFVFDVAASTRLNNIATENEKALYSNTNVQYFTAGFPVTRWWKAAFGLQPYTLVGYNLQNSQTVNDSITAIHQYTGEGGLNQFFIGNGFRIAPGFSAGFNASFVFGSLDRKTRSLFQGLDFSSEYRSTQRIIIQDFQFDFGLQYSMKLKNNDVLTAGLVFENKKPMRARVTDLSLKYLNISGVLSLDTLVDETSSNLKVDLPLHTGLGFAYSRPDKWTIGADVRYFMRDKTEFLGVTDSLSPSLFAGAGAEYIPQFNSPNRYWRRVAYRAGMHYYSTGLELNNTSINQIGISFGLGLPLRRTKTMINLSVEAGSRGTLKNNMIREQFVVFSAGLLLHDRWFVKPKYE